jgi:Ca-activated chloride channel family protein
MNELRDIHLAAPVPLTPQTWAWALVLVAAVIATGLVAWLLVRRHRANRYRRLALAEIAAVEQRAAWDELPALVKRVALQAWPREQVASLTGADWLAFLDESYGGDGFANGPGRCLSDLAYGGGDGAGAAVLVREWIRRHHA